MQYFEHLDSPRKMPMVCVIVFLDKSGASFQHQYCYSYHLVYLLGLSDPYCLMGILNEMHREKNIVKHKNLENWQKDELVECVAGTKVKQATLEPEWNEDFYL